MAERYERWLIARGNVFAPSSEAVAKLIEKLRAEGWLGEGGRAVRTVENTFGDDAAKKAAASTSPHPAVIDAEWLDHPDREELRLVWPAPASKLPLSVAPPETDGWTIEMHRALEYVYPRAKGIGALPSVCRCKEDLSFRWDDDEVVCAFRSSKGIFAECDACSRTFDPATERAKITNPFDRSVETVSGGAAYRFALVVDCGKDFVADARLAFAPELVALVEKEFGRSFYEVGALR